ncbi:MAG: porin family protein [Siphonobacter sp.]
MKKVILSTAFLLIVSLVNAQSYRRYGRPPYRQPYQQPHHRPVQQEFSTPRFGIKGGLNFSNVIISPTIGTPLSTRTSFMIGMFAEIPVAPRVGFQPELQYSSQGFNDPTGYGRVALNQVNIPLLLNLHLAPGLSIVAGPQLSYLASAKLAVNNYYNANYDAAFHRAGADVVAGLEFGSGNLVVGGRYIYGLGNLNKDYDFTGDTYTNALLQVHNSTVQLSVGLKF